MTITRPTNLSTPFANAGGKNVIPVPSQIATNPGAASWDDGFPPATRTPLVAGGVPPAGLDMNGVLNAVSVHTVFQNQGGQYGFDATLATAIGGYPVGVVLQSDDGLSSYVNVLAGNSTNFNTTPASIGVSWIAWAGNAVPGRLIKQTVYNTAGTFTFTSDPSTQSVTVEGSAAGSAGGGGPATSGNNIAAGGGGAAGGFGFKRLLTGFSGGIAVTIGAGGIGVLNGPGGNGGSSSFGSLVTFLPGGGGPLANLRTFTQSVISASGGVSGSTPTGVDFGTPGQPGTPGFVMLACTITGAGGSGPYGSGGASIGDTAGGAINTGRAGTGNGSGGGGGDGINSTFGFAGGNGKDGIIIIKEYA